MKGRLRGPTLSLPPWRSWRRPPELLESYDPFSLEQDRPRALGTYSQFASLLHRYLMAMSDEDSKVCYRLKPKRAERASSSSPYG